MAELFANKKSLFRNQTPIQQPPLNTYMDFYIGDPDNQTQFWEPQNSNDTCAIVAQTSILNQFLDDPISQDEATYVAASNGWYQPGTGTMPDDVGNLLQAYGVPVHSVDNASIEQLASELQQGHRVIVGLNSDQLWDQGPLSDFWNWVIQEFGFDNSTFQPADHAVVVTGLDLSDIDNPKVIINDSGAPDGAGHSYPLDRFMDAWENSDFNYVATSIAPNGGGPPNIDIGQFLGWGATTAGLVMGLDPISAISAGRFVDSLVTNTDWDSVLSNI